MNISRSLTRPLNWLFNAVQAVLGSGGQIDWTRVNIGFYSAGKFPVSVNGAAAAGATELTVDALEHPISRGAILDFGRFEDVTVTVGAGGALADATSVPVAALSGPLPTGTRLKFSGGAGKFAVLTAPAESGATTLTTEAIPKALNDGDTATFAGGETNVEVTEDALAGATTLAVGALPFGIADNATAYGDYSGADDDLFIPSGTIMARTEAGKLIPRRDADAETATEVLQSDARRNSRKDAKSGYGTLIEAQIYENLLPDADPATGLIPEEWRTEMAANGGRFNFKQWFDDRVS